MKLTIRTKLLLAFGLILLLSCAVNIYGLIQMDVLAGLTTKLFNHPLQVTRAILTADSGIIKMHRGMKDVALGNNVEDIRAAHVLVHQHEQEVLEQFAIVQKWILGQEGENLIKETIQIFQDWAPIRQEVITLMKKKERNKASAITKGKGAKHVALLSSKMVALTNYAADKAIDMYENAQTTRITVITTTIIALTVMLVLTGLLGFFITANIVKAVHIINLIAKQMVAGKITLTNINQANLDEVITYKDEMGELGQSFYTVANSFKEIIYDIVQVSQGLAKGNLNIMPSASYQGDFIQIKNSLETASSNLQSVVEDIVQVSQGLAEGGQNVVAKAKYTGDFLQIKNALEMAATKLAEATAQNIVQDWLKTGQTQLSEKITGEQDLTTLANNIITFLVSYLKAQVGVFYMLEDRETDNACLKLLASYAYNQRKGISNEFKIGEGLVGQAVLEKQRILMTQIPKDYMTIKSGIGETVPKQIIVIPFLYENVVKGVIEIGSLHEFTKVQLDLLEQVMSNIGIALNTAESRTKMQTLF